MFRKRRDSTDLSPIEEGKRSRVESSHEREGRSGSGWSIGGNESRLNEGYINSDDEEVDMSRKEKNTDVPIISGCDLRGFEHVIAQISNDRIVEIEEMGFGPVHTIRGMKLNVELCKMMLENFDVRNCTIKIHGRNLSITARDVYRLMGLRCRGTEVDITCSTVDDGISQLMSRLCEDDKVICLKKLRGMVLSTYDDDDMWKVCFALYALAIVFCPSRPGYVDLRLLSPLNNPSLIRTHNWALFVFNKLVDGVITYQSGEPIHVGGCLIFLQLFYLSVLGERMFIFPRVCLPAMSWGQNECDRMYDRIQHLGGFHVTKGVWVSRKYCDARSTEFSGSLDYSTGLKINVVDDMADMKSDMGEVQVAVGRMEANMYNVLPDIVKLSKAMTMMQSKLCKLRTEEGMSELVMKVKKAVVERLYSSETELVQGPATELCCRDSMNDKVPLQKGREEVPLTSYIGKETSGVIIPDRSHTICGINDLSPRTRALLAYLFSRKGRASDEFASVEIGRCGKFSVCRRDLKCLCPEHPINSEVINLMGALSFANSQDSWFLPTMFSEHAKLITSSPCPTLQLYYRNNLQSTFRCNNHPTECTKIFIPLHDDVDDHWYLAILNVAGGECEIWDTNHYQPTQDRREEYAKLTIELIQYVFGEELYNSPMQASNVSPYAFIYPTSCPVQRKKEDSGIYLIRNMQHYRQRWYEGFNAGDQRVRIALEIVNHPMNECAVTVWRNVQREQEERAATQRVNPMTSYHGSGDLDGGCSVPSFSKKFKPRVPPRW